jgi:CxxC-x17-CxxC domain-containing protein
MKTPFKGKRGNDRGGRGDFKKDGYKPGGFKSGRPRSGGFKPRFGDRDRERPDLHDAICSKCGDPCQVPFRPTGSKPIYCKKCFIKDGAPAPKRFGDRERPSFGARPAAAAPDTAKLEARLTAIEKKLDTLIEAILEDIDGDEDDEDGDEDESEK